MVKNFKISLGLDKNDPNRRHIELLRIELKFLRSLMQRKRNVELHKPIRGTHVSRESNSSSACTAEPHKRNDPFQFRIIFLREILFLVIFHLYFEAPNCYR